MKKIIGLLPKLLFSIVLVFAFLEIGLRIFPGVILLDLLSRFHETPREKIARWRGLPTNVYRTAFIGLDNLFALSGRERLFQAFNLGLHPINIAGNISLARFGGGESVPEGREILLKKMAP